MGLLFLSILPVQEALRIYENFERNIRFGSDLPVHSFRACQKIFNLCKENHYDLHMSENTMLGETIKSDARAELLNVLRKTGEEGENE